MGEITEADVEFVRDLSDRTQMGKVTWDEGPDGAFVSRKARATSVLSRGRSSSLARRASIKLVVKRPTDSAVQRTLEQRIDDAAPLALDRALNSALAWLWQLVAESTPNDLYSDMLDGPEADD